MSHEIELKFRIPDARLAALRRAVATAGAARQPLAAVYFDTAAEDLAAARVALRLRREGPRWVQTLKAEGDSALHRLEHNVALDAGDAVPALDAARHDGSAAGDALRRVLAAAPDAALQPRYATLVRRTRRVLRSAGARIELALDEGELRAGEQRLAIRELELELLDGPVGALLDQAARWAQRFDLVLDLRSKSERGHLLAAGRAASPPVPAVAGGPLAARLRPALANASVLADPATRAAVADEPGYREALHAALDSLRTALPALPQGAALVPPLADLAAQAALPGDTGGLGARLAAPATQSLWLRLIGLSLPQH